MNKKDNRDWLNLAWCLKSSQISWVNMWETKDVQMTNISGHDLDT